MTKKYLIVIGGLLAALLVVGVIGATNVFAQGSGTAIMQRFGLGGHGGPHLGSAELDAAAKALGMTTTDLSTALQSGKTLEQIATEKGVDINTVMQAIQAARPPRLGLAELTAAAKALNMTETDLTTALKSGKTLTQIASDQKVDLQTVQDAITNARREDIRVQIKQAVTDGTMTQAKADWLTEGLDKGYLDKPDFGFGGFGFGGPRGGHGGFGPLGAGNSNGPTNQTNP